ncbi:MAG TPA: flagellar motor protein MotB, partial [Hyphomicrobiaceae bacterium]|nr:flagellar motor protein MotB [Hyphomicrobiaceae bacterium]
MAAKPDDAPAEHVQIVVRHGHSEEEGHHGGVWKIAYADFMTAMMAFFLVMWLVNASNTEMKASVASYFNPIKLSDNVIRKKGLRDVDGKANAEEGSKAPAPKSSGKEAANSASQPLQPGEAVKLGADETPGAAGEPTDASFGRDGNASQGGRAAESGRAFRDPFNPFAPGQLMALEGSGKEAMTVTAPGRSGAPRDPVADSPGTTGNPGRFAEWLRHGPFGTPLPEPAGGTESSSPKSVASGQQSRIVEVPAGAGEAASVIDRTSGEVRSADTKSSDSPVGAPAGKAPA